MEDIINQIKELDKNIKSTKTNDYGYLELLKIISKQNVLLAELIREQNKQLNNKMEVIKLYTKPY